MTTPQEPAPDTETDVTPGDVAENPTDPEEGDPTPDPDHLPQGPQETNPEADDSED
jgi:hypothetical protein